MERDQSVIGVVVTTRLGGNYEQRIYAREPSEREEKCQKFLVFVRSETEILM